MVSPVYPTALWLLWKRLNRAVVWHGLVIKMQLCGFLSDSHTPGQWGWSMRVTVNSCESSSCKHSECFSGILCNTLKQLFCNVYFDLFFVFSVIHDSASCLLRLLLLAELFVHSWSRPTSSPYLCKHFASMITKVEELTKVSKKLHELVRLIDDPSICLSAKTQRSQRCNQTN